MVTRVRIEIEGQGADAHTVVVADDAGPFVTFESYEAELMRLRDRLEQLRAEVRNKDAELASAYADARAESAGERAQVTAELVQARADADLAQARDEAKRLALEGIRSVLESVMPRPPLSPVDVERIAKDLVAQVAAVVAR